MDLTLVSWKESFSAVRSAAKLAVWMGSCAVAMTVAPWGV